MLFILYVNDQQTAHRLTLEGAKDAATPFIAKGDCVRIKYRASDSADRITRWDYDPATCEWVGINQD